MNDFSVVAGEYGQDMAVGNTTSVPLSSHFHHASQNAAGCTGACESTTSNLYPTGNAKIDTYPKDTQQATGVDDLCTVYVSGLSTSHDDQQLHEAFACFGTVQYIARRAVSHDVGRVDRAGGAQQYAFVRYTNPEEAYQAVQAGKVEIDGRKLCVKTRERKAPRTGRGTQSYDKPEVNQSNLVYPDVEQLAALNSRSLRPEVMKRPGHGTHPDIPYIARATSNNVNPPILMNKCLVVVNLPPDMSPKELFNLFSQEEHAVQACYIFPHLDELGRRYGTIVMPTFFMAQKAVEIFNGANVRGHTLAVFYQKFIFEPPSAGAPASHAPPPTLALQPSFLSQDSQAPPQEPLQVQQQIGCSGGSGPTTLSEPYDPPCPPSQAFDRQFSIPTHLPTFPQGNVSNIPGTHPHYASSQVQHPPVVAHSPVQGTIYTQRIPSSPTVARRHRPLFVYGGFSSHRGCPAALNCSSLQSLREAVHPEGLKERNNFQNEKLLNQNRLAENEMCANQPEELHANVANEERLPIPKTLLSQSDKLKLPVVIFGHDTRPESFHMDTPKDNTHNTRSNVRFSGSVSKHAKLYASAPPFEMVGPVTIPENPRPTDPCNLYIKNLDDLVISSSEDLTRLFQGFGTITSVALSTYPGSEISRGFGFVSLSKPEEAATAKKALNNTLVGRKRVFVSYAERKEDRMRRLKSYFSGTPLDENPKHIVEAHKEPILKPVEGQDPLEKTAKNKEKNSEPTSTPELKVGSAANTKEIGTAGSEIEVTSHGNAKPTNTERRASTLTNITKEDPEGQDQSQPTNKSKRSGQRDRLDNSKSRAQNKSSGQPKNVQAKEIKPHGSQTQKKYRWNSNGRKNPNARQTGTKNLPDAGQQVARKVENNISSVAVTAH